MEQSKTINNEMIRALKPCYDPSEIGIPDNETLLIKEWIEKYRNTVKSREDILWVLCRKDFMTDRDMRLFAVWCAREALKLDNEPDQRSIYACDVAERYANGEATNEELDAARAAARAAAWDAASAAAMSAARAAARNAASAAAMSAARDAAWAAARDAAAWAAAWAAARNAASAAAWAAAMSTAMSAARVAQINQLMTYF